MLTLAGVLILAFIIHRAAKDINKLQQATLEREHIDSELNIARKIQMEMLPKGNAVVSRNDCNIFGSLIPAKMVGGDLFDYFIRDEKLFFCIGDVSGKGIPAALIMSADYTLYRSITAYESNPSRIMKAINEASCHNNDSNMFVTMFIGVLDLPTGRLRYCNAGHDKPFVIGQEVRTLQAKPHLPLGVMDDVLYTTEEDVLAKDDMVFLFTDGLTEAKNENREQFGLKRVETLLKRFNRRGDIPTETLINEVSERIAAFVDGAEQSDDLTMLAIHTRHRKNRSFCVRASH